MATTPTGAFDHYLEELHELPLLDAAEELALACELEELGIAHWRALLSHGPARGVVLAALEATPLVGGPLAAEMRAEAGSAIDTIELARRLRGIDRDCEGLTAADAAVQEAFAHSAGAARYLGRLASARRARLRVKGRFVTANLRLVIALARRYDHNLLPFADLVQEGNLGLMRAVERFDHRRGFRFSTYASWWIRHALNRALSNKGRMVRLPVHALDEVARIKRALAASQRAAGAVLSDGELAAQAGMSEEKLAVLRLHAGGIEPISLDKGIGEDREQTLHDVIAANDERDPDRDIDLGRWRGELDGLLTGLSSIEATTLRLRFGLDGAEELSLREIGGKYNLSRERIRQIQEEALSKLRLTMRRRQRPHDDKTLAA